VPLADFARSSTEASELSVALTRLFEASQALLEIPDAPSFRADNEELMSALDRLEQTPFLRREGDNYHLRMAALKEVADERARTILDDCGRILEILRTQYKNKEARKSQRKLVDLSDETHLPFERVRLCVGLLLDESWAWAQGWKGPPAPPEEWFMVPGENILRYKSIDVLMTELDRQVGLVARDRFGLQLPLTNRARARTASAAKTIRFETAFESYEPEEQIGQGGSATVYRVRDSEGATFAIKMLRPEALTPSRLKRFRNEAAFCQRTDHANILHVVEMGAVSIKRKKYPFLVTPFYPRTLRDLIVSGMKPDEALYLFGQVLDGIEAAHRVNVIHRDLKPENILVNTQSKIVVVGDFGIAHFSEEELITAVETRAADRLANFVYAAPEQRIRGGAVDASTDIYALGLILNEIFTSSVPQGTGFRHIGDVVPALSYLDQVVDRAVRNNQNERFRSIGELRGDLVRKRLEHESDQTLESLKQQVVKSSSDTDDLAIKPPELSGFDYDGQYLDLQLDRSIHPAWVEAFHSIGDYSSYPDGTGSPRGFQFSGNKARVQVGPLEAQQVVDWFKSYLPKATQVYNERLTVVQRHQEAAQREAIKRRQELEERRNQVLKSLKI